MVLLCFANLCSPSFQFVYFNVFGSITCFLFICSSLSVLYDTVIDANMLCCNPSMQHARDGSKAVPYCTRDSFVFLIFWLHRFSGTMLVQILQLCSLGNMRPSFFATIVHLDERLRAHSKHCILECFRQRCDSKK